MNGYELERMITELTSDQHLTDLDDFLSGQVMPTGTMIVTKRVIKSSDIMQGHGIEPDFMVFQHIGSSQMCYVVELKDGHEFDTKSSAKEHANLRQFITINADRLWYFQVYTEIVGFNARSNEEIRIGFKKRIDPDPRPLPRRSLAVQRLRFDVDEPRLRHDRNWATAMAARKMASAPVNGLMADSPRKKSYYS